MQYFVSPAMLRIILSLSMICLRCVSTVLALSESLAAISFVDPAFRDQLQDLQLSFGQIFG